MATLKEILTHRPVAGAIRFTLPAGVADAKYNKGVISKTLSKYFVNISSFIKKFNADTQKYKPETPIAVQVTVYKGRLFDMTYKSPHVAWYLKNAAGIELGTGDPGKVVAGTVSLKHVYEIAKIKRADPSCQYMSMESICKSIVGTANSMGIRVLEDLD